MGKSLIIPGADFSANSIGKYVKEIYAYPSNMNANDYDPTSKFSGDYYILLGNLAEMQNHTINYIESFIPALNDGIMNLLVVDTHKLSDFTTEDELTIIKLISIPVTTGLTQFSFESITLLQNQGIFVNALGIFMFTAHIPKSKMLTISISSSTTPGTIVNPSSDMSSYSFTLSYGYYMN